MRGSVDLCCVADTVTFVVNVDADLDADADA